MSRIVQVFQAGRMNYRTALDLQTFLASRHHDKLSTAINPNVIVLVEHQPVYTTGIRSKSYTAEDEEKLKRLGAEFYRTNRGGLITFHGPGQLVAYPILNLKHFTPSVRWYVSQIENTIINLCQEFGIIAYTSPHTGVWVNDKKICAIGIHGSRFVTTHGLALNCNTKLDWYDYIVPCGIEGKGVTSLSKELSKIVTIENVAGPFLKSFSELFDCELCYFPQDELDRIVKTISEKEEKRTCN